MCHYVGTKSFARVRAEMTEEAHEEPDVLAVWLKTHEPKKGSKLDEASVAAKEEILNELAAFPEGKLDKTARCEIFKMVVGEDKNGYAKTFGLGVTVPRSSSKRCALQEERAKRIKSDEKVEHLEKRLDKAQAQLGLSGMLKKLLEQQGMSSSSVKHEDHEDGEEYRYEFEDEFGVDLT